MGAQQFEVEVEADTAAKAFTKAVDSARWEYGHGGYTGTIAEKWGWCLFTLPVGVDPHLVADILPIADYDPVEFDRLAKMVGSRHLAQQLVDQYCDKWGDAVTFRTDKGWLFCGLASS